MNQDNMVGTSEVENPDSHEALLIAFKTMKERCHQLQNRLAAVEQENICRKTEYGKDVISVLSKADDNSDKTLVQMLKDKVEELTKQKQQLTHHIVMVAAENKQLWNRLTKLTRTNKSLGNQLTKISDTIKQHPSQQCDISAYNFSSSSPNKSESNKKLSTAENDDQEQSLEEISLRLINSIMLEKSDLEQQYAEMVELQNTELKLKNLGFTYPEDCGIDSIPQMKQYDNLLAQNKDVLLAQQAKLKKIILNLKEAKNVTVCSNCRKNTKKKMCQAGTQFDSDESLQEHDIPIITSADTMSPDRCHSPDKTNYNICPLCGALYSKSILFTEFHEHVINHFTQDVPEGFEIIN